MERRKRKHYSAQEKIRLLKKHLVDGVSVSEVCRTDEVKPVVYYRWQKDFFEKGHVVFEQKRGPKERKSKDQVKELQLQVHKKNEVIAELMAAYVDQKKKNGGT